MRIAEPSGPGSGRRRAPSVPQAPRPPGPHRSPERHLTGTRTWAPPDIHLGPLLVAAPAITPSFGGPRTVGLVAALAVVAQTAIGVLRDPDELLSANHEAQIIALVLVGTSLVIFCVLRDRRARELAQVRYVSDAAQRVVLPPLPERVGPLRVAAHRRASLGELVTYLDRSVCWDLTEPGESDRYGETFITATVLDIPDGDGPVQMVSCGHPPPLVLRDGRPTTMYAPRPAPPLGLGELTHPLYHVDSFPFEPGDLLLLYTDGVTEARDSTGTFYPLAERVTGWTETDPDTFLGRLRRDLLHHVGGHLNDDAAMIVIERAATPRA